MGRPREFCVDMALDKALKVFWSKGYEGTSLTDLTEAMGITRPSLYSAYGSKEELFRRALDRYGASHLGFVTDALAAATVREAIERLLYGLADAQTECDSPGGCMALNGALVCSEEGDPIRRELIRRREQSRIALRERLEKARAEGDLPDSTDTAKLALFITAVANGMAVQAASGVSREALYGVVEVALTAWPSR
ncbi:MAG TPA: TetR/AcrR family transcriptional regulator [Stellaceae bacterium]|nr:TetR/AcrR family transcriptional regulator [Stellaceae bacterium]